MFLLAEHRVSGLWNMSILLACGVSFVLSQRTTYAVQHAADLRGKSNLGQPNLGKLMFMPYVRILPMHLGIILDSGLGDGAFMLVLFTALKTLSDIALDRWDRKHAGKTASRADSSSEPP